MTRHWQLMRDAQTFLGASMLANNALIGIHFAQIAKSKGTSPNVDHINKIDDGIKLLTEVLKTLEARERQEKVSSEALSVLYAISQGRLVREPLALKRIIAGSIDELQRFKGGEIETLEEAEGLLEIIVNSTAEEATKASSKIRIFMMEAR
ncbi:MAG: hypothetical protein AOA66_0492 [Candidatus Bathyarchaeota archaeon BA2]|nr:MAG: hypothetical protein AOA66_0492 [Candidatus Bathyarchaeota archaeon BA2]